MSFHHISPLDDNVTLISGNEDRGRYNTAWVRDLPYGTRISLITRDFAADNPFHLDYVLHWRDPLARHIANRLRSKFLLAAIVVVPRGALLTGGTK